MIFFLCFLCSQLLRAETQDSGGVLISVLNALTAMKNMFGSVSEEYQHKPRRFGNVLERSGQGLRRTGTHSTRRRWPAPNFGHTERRLMLPDWQMLAWGADSQERGALEELLWTRLCQRVTLLVRDGSAWQSCAMDQGHLSQMPLDDFP